MKTLALLVVSFLAVTLAKRQGPLPHKILKDPSFNGQPEERIVGGQEVDPKYSIPYQVSFKEFGSHVCGGSIINKNFVLTSAHCCQGGDAEYITVVAGEHDRSIEEGFEQERYVAKIINHEDFDFITITNDVCLLQLTEPFEFGNEVKAASLPEKDQLFESGVAIVSGWGSLHSGGSLTDKLQSVEVPILSDTACEDAYGESLFPEQMICAGEEGKDSCQGDSGGPLTCDGIHCGVVSWGYGCAQAEYPGVYAETSHFIDWINGKIKNH